MESVKTGKTNKVGKNAETANTKANKETHFKQASAITNTLRSIGGFFTKIAKRVRELVKKHPKKSNAALVVLTHVVCRKAKELDDKVQDKSKQAEKENQINWWKYSGLTIATSLLLAACSVGDIDKQIELEQEQQKTEQERQKTEQEKQKTINTQKDFIKYAEQNCQENHGQFFIKKVGIKAGIGIEVEAECKTLKPTKTNQTPIQPKHLPNSKQPRSQRGSKAQELITYLQKELESLPYSQKAIAKQVDFYKPSSIAYLELDPRDFKATEEWQKENLKIRSKAQAKMLEMRDLKPDPQAHLSTSQSLLFVQKIFADVSKGIEAAANTEKKVEKAGYGYSKRM
ncbi:hypothetical protein HPHPP13_1447 [Helicobacter pylori Hp P-13]|uniref:DUF874 family protein n=1 Tax=Helicobacter pylori Hp P-13b TaxID=992107 RepID=A0ABC9QPI7_HELPX|nr:DUF874 family protein [Helicobacter pylori]EJC05921.1 hypothetical protein HPHPP13_1447 [Helicobacter pylori Hp P-13]EJC30354.1 hypothetical protein HPHPP13B_1388 [Helicobacter pylori Hp P-13b]